MDHGFAEILFVIGGCEIWFVWGMGGTGQDATVQILGHVALPIHLASFDLTRRMPPLKGSLETLGEI